MHITQPQPGPASSKTGLWAALHGSSKVHLSQRITQPAASLQQNWPQHITQPWASDSASSKTGLWTLGTGHWTARKVHHTTAHYTAPASSKTGLWAALALHGSTVVRCITQRITQLASSRTGLWALRRGRGGGAAGLQNSKWRLWLLAIIFLSVQ